MMTKVQRLIMVLESQQRETEDRAEVDSMDVNGDYGTDRYNDGCCDTIASVLRMVRDIEASKQTEPM